MMGKISIVTFIFLLSNVAVALPKPSSNYVPKKTIPVATISFVLNGKMKSISERLKAAMRKHSDYFDKKSLTVKVDQAIPYDPKMEISEEEYRLFHKKAHDHLTVKTTGTAQLIAKKTGQLIEINLKGAGIDKIPLIYNADTDTFKIGTSLTSKKSEPFDNDVFPTGPIKGYGWDFSNPEMKANGYIEIAKLKRKKKCLFIFRAQQSDENDNPILRKDVHVMYSCEI